MSQKMKFSWPLTSPSLIWDFLEFGKNWKFDNPPPSDQIWEKIMGPLGEKNKTSWSNARGKLHSQVHFGLWMKIGYRTIFRDQNFFVSQFLVKNICCPKEFWVKIFFFFEFGFTKFLSQENFWPNKLKFWISLFFTSLYIYFI